MAGLSKFLFLFLSLSLFLYPFPSLPTPLILILLSLQLSLSSSMLHCVGSTLHGIEAGSDKYRGCIRPEVTHHLFCHILLVTGPTQIQWWGWGGGDKLCVLIGREAYMNKSVRTRQGVIFIDSLPLSGKRFHFTFVSSAPS